MTALRDSDGWARRNLVGCVAIVLIVVLTVLGGGGFSSIPVYDAVCQGAGFMMIAFLVATGGTGTIDRAAWPWLVLAVLAFLLPMAQLVPLPAHFVEGLPGRALANAIRSEATRLGTAGATARHPFTLDPDATLASALCLVPGIAMFAVVLRSDVVWRRRLVIAWIVLAVLAVLIGALQVASRGTMAEMYNTPHNHAATGFFVNRNHNSIFLLVVLVLSSATLFSGDQHRHGAFELLRYALLLLLAAGLLIASSRAGILLLVLCAPIILLFARRGGAGVSLNWRVVGGIAAALTVLALFLAYNPVARAVMNRFSFGTDARWNFWPDVIYTARHFWPAGTGIGTFQAIFASQERLSTINEMYVNHAHNDYLELVIEGGAAAVVLMGVFAVLFVWRLVAVIAFDGPGKHLALAGAVGIVVLLLHSLVDYPLRAITLTAMFGFMVGLMFPVRTKALAVTRTRTRAETPS